MFVSNTRRTALYSISAAVAAVIFAPLLALSYFATNEGAEELEVATVSAWAEPARDVAGGLVTFASPDRVYSTYTLLFALLFPAVIVAASVARSHRHASQTRPEVWGWRLALVGYVMFGAGLGIVAIALQWAAGSSPIVDAGFMALMFPGILLSLIGSSVLGSALVRAGYQPRLTAWLLALAFPLWAVGNLIIGHNSIGLVPLFIAWAANSAALKRVQETEPAMSFHGYEGSSV